MSSTRRRAHSLPVGHRSRQSILEISAWLQIHLGAVAPRTVETRSYAANSWKNVFSKGTSFGAPERIESIAYSSFGRLLRNRESHHSLLFADHSVAIVVTVNDQREHTSTRARSWRKSSARLERAHDSLLAMRRQRCSNCARPHH